MQRAEESLQEIDHDSSSLLIMQGRIDGRLCRDILIDPGASSNFVRREWAQGCRLREETLRVPLTVKLAVGQLPNRLMGGVAVKSAEVEGSSAPCTLVAMEQLSHAVILGMPWLKRAGVDLGLRTGSMTWNQRPITVLPSGRATALHSVKVDSDYTSVMARILGKYPVAFSKELRKRSPWGQSESFAVSCDSEGPQLQARVQQATTTFAKGYTDAYRSGEGNGRGRLDHEERELLVLAACPCKEGARRRGAGRKAAVLGLSLGSTTSLSVTLTRFSCRRICTISCRVTVYSVRWI